MTPDDLSALYDAAKAATPGEWEVLHGVPPHRRTDELFLGDGHGVALSDERGAMSFEDVHFIALANPTRILSLIAELCAARAVAEAARFITEGRDIKWCREAVEANHATGGRLGSIGAAVAVGPPLSYAGVVAVADALAAYDRAKGEV